MSTRRRFENDKTFAERLAEEAQRFKESADKLAPGSQARELLLQQVRKAETASRINNWALSRLAAS